MPVGTAMKRSPCSCATANNCGHGNATPLERHHLRAVEYRAGIELAGVAEAAQERRESLAAGLGEQAPQWRTLGEHARIGQRVLGHARDFLARVGARELHVDLLLAVRQSAQHVDGEVGNARRHQQHDGHVAGCQPPSETVALHRRRYPVPRSTSVLMISVTTASSDNMEATANAPTKLYSL